MVDDFSIIDRLRLAFKVMGRWEVLATLAAFVLFWLLVRYVADPWRSEERPKLGFRPHLKSKADEGPPAIAPSADDDHDEELPD
jgi:hypothetical protein